MVSQTDRHTLKRYYFSVELEKVKLFGMGYVFNTIIAHYLKDEENKLTKEHQFKTLSYIAQGVQMISNNTAYIPVMPYWKDGEPQALPDYIDFINGVQKEEKSADEIVNDVLDKCGFLGG